MTVALFIAAAAIATLTRAIVTASPAGGRLPWRTLLVNCAGAFALGGWVATGKFVSYDIVVAVAGLGSFTTFSTVAGEAAALCDDGHKRTAVAYVGLTLIAGVAAARLGLEIGARL